MSLSRLAKISAQSIIRLLSWLLQLREIPDVTIVESLVTCARTVCPPQKGEKVMTSFPLGIVRTVARAGNGQRNATLNSTKTDYPFRETSNWASTPAPSTPIGAFRTAINIREFEEMQFPTIVQPPAEAQGWTWSPPRAHPKGTGSSNYSSHQCLGTFALRNSWFNLKEIQYYYQRHICSASVH